MSLSALWHSLQWREPLWLLLGLLPLLVVLLRRLRQRQRLDRLADPHLLPWLRVETDAPLRKRLLSRDSAWILAWLLLAVAAAGPRSVASIAGEPLAGGPDILIVLDLSRSMQAADVAPDRLRRARTEIHQLMARAAGARIGLIVFAGRPHLLVPLTADHQALAFYLTLLDALALPTRGSRAAPALRLAARELAGRKGAAVLLVSDGEVEAEADLDEAARALARQRHPLFVLGMGSAEGEAVPTADGDWLRHDDQAVISRLDEQRLQRLARLGQGRYHRVSDDDHDWQALHDQGMATLAGAARVDGDDENVLWKEYYPWALAPAVLLLFLALMPCRLPARRPPAALALLCTLLLWNLPPQPGHAADLGEHDARQALLAGDPARAQQIYESLRGYAARFGEGASRYRQGDFEGAVRQFSRATLLATDDRSRGLALYNLGNSYVQLGRFALAADVYQDALRYLPDHAPSRHNRQLSLALQAQLEARLAEDIRSGRASRAGRGPRQREAEAGIELDASSAVALGEEQEGRNGADALPGLPRNPGGALARLLERGVEQARLAAEGQDTARVRRHQQDRLRARLHMQELHDDRTRPWQRLFEMEEGFPAPLAAPRTLPGVKPW